MYSGNPVLSPDRLKGVPRSGLGEMSISGTIAKTAIALLILVGGAALSWYQASIASPWLMPLIWGGTIGGLVVALVTVFKQSWAPITAPIYAWLEGLVLGGISALFEARFPGVAMQAVALTFGVLFSLLLAYQAGIIRASEPFRRGIVAATGGIVLVYLVSFVLGFFGISNPLVSGTSLVAIAFNVFVVVIAALNLVLDFDLIERLTNSSAPHYMEWYAAFGLMVTLVWLYIEILNLLVRLQGRSRE